MTHEGEPTTLSDENPEHEIRDDRALSLVFRRQAQESMKRIAIAKDLVWRDLGVLMRRKYMDMARRDQ